MSVNVSLYIYNFNYAEQLDDDFLESESSAAILCELRKSQDAWEQTPLSDKTNRAEQFPLAAPKTNEFKRTKNDEENGSDLYIGRIFNSRQPRDSRQRTDLRLKATILKENENI